MLYLSANSLFSINFQSGGQFQLKFAEVELSNMLKPCELHENWMTIN